jgi:diadenosine tetraphosphate (Ap4A) HIT family hydrolase
MNEKECIFCNLDPNREIIAQNDLALAFFDAFPVNPGHALIIPKRHVADYFDLTEDEVAAMQALLREVKAIVEKRFNPDGYNIGVNVNAAAGQSVFHVHMHLIPRYKGDVENPKGGVRGVIPSKQKY